MNCPATFWSAWTGNKLALNLAPTLNQAEVIKRNMNCGASEKWQTPPVKQKDVNMEKLMLPSVLSDTIFWNYFSAFVWTAQKNGSKWDYVTQAERKNATNPQCCTSCSSVLKKSALPGMLSTTDACIVQYMRQLMFSCVNGLQQEIGH